jgi:hypothetical protein
MEFKKDQLVRPTNQLLVGALYAVEAGPFACGSRENERPHYVVKVLAGPHTGLFRFYDEANLAPVAPKRGDRGELVSRGSGPYTVEYIGDLWVLMINRLDKPYGLTREDFDRDWRPLS